VQGLAPSQAAPTVGDTVIYEGFENWPFYAAGGSWLLRDYGDSDGGQYFWGGRTCDVYAGQLSGFAAGGGSNGSTRSCTSKYPKNAQSWAFLGPFDLHDVISATLTLWIKGRSEWNSNPDGTCNSTLDDYTFVGAAISTVANVPPIPDDVFGWCQAGDWSSQYEQVSYDLARLDEIQRGVLGKTGVYFGIYFSSDTDDIRFSGLSIDEFLITLHRAPQQAPPPKTYLPIAIHPPPAPQIGPCPDIEPNDTPTQAKLITTLGRACFGSLQADSEDDWYAVDVAAGKAISLDLTNMPAGSDYDLYLFEQIVATDPTKGLVGISDKGGNADEHIDYASTKTQRYYIRIFIRNKAGNNSYQLRVSAN
jgi:hypothetical protein